MRKYIVFSISAVAMVAYTLFWFVFTGAMVNVTNERVFKDRSGNYSIVLGKVSREGFPFRLGIKIQSVVEDGLDSVITHQAPLMVEYEVFRQRFHISYYGSSVAQPKPLEHGFGSLVKSEVDIYASCPLSLSLIEVLKDQGRGFELVNFVKSISSNVKVKANDLVESSLMIDAEYSHRVDIKAAAYYKNIEDLMVSNLANSYHIVSKMKVKQVAQNRLISPVSVIYGVIPRNKIEMDLSADVSFPFMNPMSDFEIRLTEDSTSDLITDDHGSIYIKSKFIDRNGYIDFVAKNVSNVKEGYIDYINSNIALFSAALANGGVPKGISDILQDIAVNPDKYKLPHVDIKKFTVDIDVSLRAENDVVDIEVRSLNLLADDTGIKLQNKTRLDNKFAWNTAGLLSINNYGNMFDYVSAYIKQISPGSLSDDRSAIEKIITSELLRFISNHPESKNSEMIFNYSGASSDEEFKVGDRNIAAIVDLYNRFLYTQALNMIKSDPQFINKISILMPELFSNKEVMKKLKEASGPQGAN